MQYVSKTSGPAASIAVVILLAICSANAIAGSVADVDNTAVTTCEAADVWNTRIDETDTTLRDTINHGMHVRPTEPEATAPLPPAVTTGAAMLLIAGARKAIRNLK